MRKTLFAGFEGENNSAKILLDKFPLNSNVNKLYLKNDFEKCASQIMEYIKEYDLDLIVAFGQKPLIKSIYIEEYGSICGQRYKTKFQSEYLRDTLVAAGYKVKLSNDAGNYLCNHVYAVGLRYIEQKNLALEYLFIHIPFVKNLKDIDLLAKIVYKGL